MDIYDRVAYDNSRHLTLSYSTSFGISSRFFAKSIRADIYAIYGMVRIADEIVDTYKGSDAAKLLDEFEVAVYAAMKSGYSTNPIIHAFCLTARRYDISKVLIEPFFASMRMDLQPASYSPKDYKKYIHGSAEVVGLMCLRVFCDNDEAQYMRLRDGAAALGSAYQKVNFLRDMAADYIELGRLYFPGMTYDAFDDEDKHTIIDDIKKDFAIALPALNRLPASSRMATIMSYVYYSQLVDKLERTPADSIKKKRIRISSPKKISLLLLTVIRHGAGRW